MKTQMQLNTVTNSPTDQAGNIEQYTITLTGSGKYVLEVGGSANVLAGIYGPFQPGQEVAEGQYGKLRVCGVGRRGVRTLTAGSYLIQVVQNTPGSYTLKLRHWSFTDYFTIGFYKSTC